MLTGVFPLSDPPAATPVENPEQVAIYVELREKTTDLMGAGSNMLGHLWAPLGAFQDVLPPNLADASITRIWLRANKLRSVLRAHDHIKDVPEGGHPAEIDPACAEHLRDVVETINVFILGDPKGSELDQNRLGPGDRAEAAELLELAKPVIEAAGEITTDETMNVLTEQVAAADAAPETIDGDQAVSLARNTSSNFVLAVVRNAFSKARQIIGAEFHEFWQKFKGGVYSKAGDATGVAIVVYVASQAPALTAFAEKAINNPMVARIIEFLSRLFA